MMIRLDLSIQTVDLKVRRMGAKCLNRSTGHNPGDLDLLAAKPSAKLRGAVSDW